MLIKKLLLISMLFTVIVVVFGCTTMGTNTQDDGVATDNTNSINPPSTDEFVLNDDNFEFVTIQYTSPQDIQASNTQLLGLESDCDTFLRDPLNAESWVTNKNFYVMYNVKDVPDKFLQANTVMLIKPLACKITIDGETYSKLDTYAVGVNTIASNEFCNPAVMSTTWQVCVEPSIRPTMDFTVDHDITLCCDDVCETKTLPRYCVPKTTT